MSDIYDSIVRRGISKILKVADENGRGRGSSVINAVVHKVFTNRPMFWPRAGRR